MAEVRTSKKRLVESVKADLPPSTNSVEDTQANIYNVGSVKADHGHDFNKVSVSSEGASSTIRGGWVKKGGEYKWGEEKECLEDVLCEDAIAVVKGENLVVYGSQGANDIIEYKPNEKGMFDTFELSKHPDFSNMFAVKNAEENPARFLDSKRTAALLNATSLYHDIYPKDDPFALTGGSDSEGKSLKPSLSHKLGERIDGRYFGTTGKAIQGEDACKDADPERMKVLFLAFELQKAGLGAPLTGAPDRFNLGNYDDALKSIHCNHVHLQNSYPKIALDKMQEPEKGSDILKSNDGKKKRKGK